MLNLIIPMAGKGKRMLPHTLTTPKPLIPIAGKPIVLRLLEEIKNLYSGPIGSIGFIVNGLLPNAKLQLEEMATKLGAIPHFFEQTNALGTAHAIRLAQSLLNGPILIAFADTLFKGGSLLDISKENIIWVNKVQNPGDFGVVQTDSNNVITHLVEKPTTFISDLAIIGLYYFREGKKLQEAICHIINKEICNGGEYQLTSALTYMQQQGSRFLTQLVDEWLDCGNKDNTLYTHQRFLELIANDEKMIAETASIQNSKIIPPVYIGENATIKNTVLGPYVSVGTHTHITGSRIKNSIIQEHTTIKEANLVNSMIGDYVHVEDKAIEINIGNHNTILL